MGKRYLSKLFMVLLLVCTINVKAETISENFKQILNNNDTITLTYDGFTDKDMLITNYLDEFNTNNSDNEYYFYADTNECTDNYTKCNIQKINRDTNDLEEEHIININYNEIYSNEFKNIIKNGSLIVEESTLLESKTNIITDALKKYKTDSYYFEIDMMSGCNDDNSVCNIMLITNDGKQEKHEINIKYEEKYSDDYNRFANKGEIVITWTREGSDSSLIANYIGSLNDEKYYFNLQQCNGDYSTCDGILYNIQTNQSERHVVTIKFEEKYSEKFQKLTKDGNLTITSSTTEDKKNLINNYIFNIELSENLKFILGECNENIDKCKIGLYNSSYKLIEQHTINIKYEEKYSEKFQRLTKDGNIIINSSGDNREVISQYLSGFYTNENLNEISYSVQNCNDDVTVCTISMSETIDNINRVTEQHVVKIIYEEKYSEEFKKITSDGNLVIESITSEDFDSEFLLTAKINDLIDTSKYIGYGYCDENNECIVSIQSNDGIFESHKVKITIKEPSKEIQNIVNDTIKNMKKLDLNQNPFDLRQGYILDDLYLINYFNSIRDINDWNYYVSSKPLKFSKELIDLTNGRNVSFGIDLRAGDTTDLWDFAFGKAIVYYDGIAYSTVDAAITQIHTLYISNNTENTKEAYIKAVQSRIDSYFGKNDIKVTYGGLLNDLDEYNKEYGLIDYSKTDGNYYNIKIGKKTYSFVIIKIEEDKLENPTYIGSDIMSNVSISSKEAEIPLDTTLSVKKVQDERIQKAVNTNNYLAYDIKLFSNTKGTSITKLSNGKFKVSIPVSDELNGKELTTYYINDNNELIEYKTTVENGYATFETDHFSIYILVEKQNNTNNDPIIENPNTYDDIMMWITLGLISIGGIVGTTVYKRKQNI